MANKKKNQVEINEVEEQELPELFHDGDYFTAMVKVRGKKELVKIRGIIKDDGYGFSLLNNQTGDEADCDDDSHGFNYEVVLDGNTQSDLDDAGIVEFSVVTDKRVKKVIDGDQFPEIAGFRPRKRANGNVVFGCGAVEVTQKDIANWLTFMKLIKGKKGYKDFLNLNETIAHEAGSADDIIDIDLGVVEKLLD
jgi:hypothetical protein